MITCLYCGYECPDNAQICPNCGKPIPNTRANSHTLSPVDIKKLMDHGRSAITPKPKKSHLSNMIVVTTIIIALILLLYKFVFNS